jgi:hypothetical protein
MKYLTSLSNKLTPIALALLFAGCQQSQDAPQVGRHQQAAWTPMSVHIDPLVRQPGTQPTDGVKLESTNTCLSCHGGYDEDVEPAFNWQGSMMAQSARDFLFWPTLAVAAQDSIHVLGRPNATDLCLRCHTPKGWIEGRSDPPNGSALKSADFEGVQCDVCHRMYDPFFEATANGSREGSDWSGYWDEASASSQTQAEATAEADRAEATTVTQFNGKPFYEDGEPVHEAYTESASGQYYLSREYDKRGPFADHIGRHAARYSRFHKSRFFCSTCHDVSNAVLANLDYKDAVQGDGSTVLPSELESAFGYFHVERTFSEFRLSAYGVGPGSPGIGPFAPEVFETSRPDNLIATCQDCHMRDVVGPGADRFDAFVRPTQSGEHPKSGQPLHDFTGGNIFVPVVLASAIKGSPNYDETNATLLGQGADALTVDPTKGSGLVPAALLAAAERAKQMLRDAASIQQLSFDAESGQLSFRLQNQSGHKLITGYPEGRRMFLNVQAYQGDTLLYEVNPYDPAADTLKGLPAQYSPNSPALAASESYRDELVYEMHPTSTITGEQKTFHFVLGTGSYKDNRIPPKGFRIAEASTRRAEPAWNGAFRPDYFSAEEYAGGYDDVSLTLPITEADRVVVSLYYQVTSREYIEFLETEIKGEADGPRPLTLPPSAYIAQTDPFFAKLKAWGDTIGQLWRHNRDRPGAAPFLMTQASVETGDPADPDGGPQAADGGAGPEDGSPDGSTTEDAGTQPDGGNTADGGVGLDGSTTTPDSGVDAGVTSDASTSADAGVKDAFVATSPDSRAGGTDQADASTDPSDGQQSSGGCSHARAPHRIGGMGAPLLLLALLAFPARRKSLARRR